MLRLVIVDDEELTRSAIKKMIDYREIGYEVVGCGKNGREGYEVICEEFPDVVITDIKMPGLNGLELIERVKAIDQEIDFVILSGYGEFEYARRGIHMGVADYLLKPVKKSHLQETLITIKERREKQHKNHYHSGEIIGTENCTEKIKQYVQEHYCCEDLSLKWLAENLLFMNAQYLSKLFIKAEGRRFSEYLLQVRMEKAKEQMAKNPQLELRTAAQMSGFGNNPGYFGRVFKRYTGQSPGEYMTARIKRCGPEDSQNEK